MKPLADKLVELKKREVISCHMPGHKYQKLNTLGWHDIDMTEISGTDNLYAAEGILKEAQDYLSRAYHTKASRYLVNGSTIGIMASVLALKDLGENLLIGRNCHKSVYNACEIGGIAFDTVLPNILESGVIMAYSPYHIIDYLTLHPNVKVVVLTSPSYYGYVTDVSEIVTLLNKRQGFLIVDGAHGAHLNYCENNNLCALKMGAHIVVQSAHKMLPAMTQTAFLHYHNNTQQAIIDKIDRHIEMLQTSSPSYVLMSSMDLAIRAMQDNQRVHIAHEKKIKRLINSRLKPWLANSIPQDTFKLWLETAKMGYNGHMFEKALNQAGINVELATDWGVLLYLSHYNTINDIEAIIEFVCQYPKKPRYHAKSIIYENHSIARANHQQVCRDIEIVACHHAVGRYIAEDVIPYPPGVKYILKGEKLTQQKIEGLKTLQKNHGKVIGVKDKTLKTLCVYK